MPPSLAKANIIRELAVTEKVLPQEAWNVYVYHIFRCCVTYPQKYIAPMTMVFPHIVSKLPEKMINVLTMRTIAPFSPTVSKNICVTGCVVAELIVPSRSCIEKSKPKIRNHPNTADTPMAIIIPIGPATAACEEGWVIYLQADKWTVPHGFLRSCVHLGGKRVRRENTARHRRMYEGAKGALNYLASKP